MPELNPMDTNPPEDSTKEAWVISKLLKIDTFSSLTTEELKFILKHSTTRIYSKQTLLIKEGAHSNALYIILSGQVRVFISDPSQREMTLNIQNPGEYFGELSLIDNEPRSASVITLEESELTVIRKRDFHRCLRKHPQMYEKMLATLSKRIRTLTEITRDMAFLSVYQRVIRVLERLAIPKNDERVIYQTLKHGDIANMVGASRRMVSEVMRILVKDGHIEVKKGIIYLHGKLPTIW